MFSYLAAVFFLAAFAITSLASLVMIIILLMALFHRLKGTEPKDDPVTVAGFIFVMLLMSAYPLHTLISGELTDLINRVF